MITTINLIKIIHTYKLGLFVVRTFKIYLLSQFGICNTMVLGGIFKILFYKSFKSSLRTINLVEQALVLVLESGSKPQTAI